MFVLGVIAVAIAQPLIVAAAVIAVVVAVVVEAVVEPITLAEDELIELLKQLLRLTDNERLSVIVSDGENCRDLLTDDTHAAELAGTLVLLAMAGGGHVEV